MPGSAPAISIENLTKRYGNLVAVDGISFQVEPGELFGFLGPNGAGKTTTVNILTGVSFPTAGSADIFGHDVVKDSFRAKELLGIVPEVSNAYVEYSAWNNLMFTGALYGVPRKETASRAAELLEKFDLYDKRAVKVKSFSQGMRRKLVVAMALVNEPRVLFMDEPTTGLDVQSVLTIRDMIRELNQRGMTIFLTTHNLAEANILCDRVAIINRGKIAAIDTPENLKRAAQSVQAVEVAFDRTAAAVEEGLASLPEIGEVRRLGDKLRLITDDVPGAIDAVTRYAKGEGLRIAYINTPGPSLEDVFVKLTGIREPGGEGGGA
jgi:ABC-2 type transport system ATP-binding protein